MTGDDSVRAVPEANGTPAALDLNTPEAESVVELIAFMTRNETEDLDDETVRALFGLDPDDDVPDLGGSGGREETGDDVDPADR